MSSTIKVNNIQNLAGDDSGIDLSTNDQIILKTANTTALTIDSSQNATFASKLATTNLGTGAVLQVVNVQDGAVATTTGTVSYDDTIMQNNEGGEFMTLAITPTSATNKLKIDVCFNGSANTGNKITTVGLFQDTTADALAEASVFVSATNCPHNVNFTHFMTAGTTSATTFKVRGGNDTSSTLTMNGQNGSRKYGGVFASSITITEIAV